MTSGAKTLFPASIRGRSHQDASQAPVCLRRAERAETEAEEPAWSLLESSVPVQPASNSPRHRRNRSPYSEARFRRIRPQEARIILMEGGPRVLPPYPEDLSPKRKKLVKNSAWKSCSALRHKIDAESVCYGTGETSGTVPARTVFWRRPHRHSFAQE